MKTFLLILIGILQAVAANAQLAIGVDGGVAATSKINYAANKTALLFSGRILYTTPHFEGGLLSRFYLLDDPAYTSVMDLGLVANGKISLNLNFENRGGYVTVGGGLSYGRADFGRGMGIGLQAAYGYQFNEHISVVAELSPRYYDFKIDQDIYAGKWKGFAINTIDRFIVVPATIGILVRL